MTDRQKYPPLRPGWYGTRKGSFGTVTRRFVSALTGEEMCVFQRSPGGSIFSVPWADVYYLGVGDERKALQRLVQIWRAQEESCDE